MILFILGISVMLNILLIFVLIKLKDKLEIKECVIDEKAFEDFEKDNKSVWNSFYNNNK